MSAGPDHEFWICRTSYASARLQGAPSVSITKLAKDFYVAETKDGRCRMEGASGCCAWAIKFLCAEKWLDMKTPHD